MGLTTEQFLSMEMWQYNAYSLAYKDRMRDELTLKIQASYLGAYWAVPARNKKSLQAVLSSLHGPSSIKKTTERVNYREASNIFREYEELKNNGWTNTENDNN